MVTKHNHNLIRLTQLFLSCPLPLSHHFYPLSVIATYSPCFSSSTSPLPPQLHPTLLCLLLHRSLPFPVHQTFLRSVAWAPDFHTGVEMVCGTSCVLTVWALVLSSAMLCSEASDGEQPQVALPGKSKVTIHGWSQSLCFTKPKSILALGSMV